MRTAFGATLALAAAALAGCVTDEYAYRTDTAGLPSAGYPVPPDAPRGRVHVSAPGIALLRRRGAGERPFRAMHVRLVIENGSDDAWMLDTRDQVGVLGDGERSRPAFAVSNTGSPPVVIVPARTRSTVELYYPLPRTTLASTPLAAFDILWRVNVPGRAVEGRTAFERVAVEAGPAPEAGWYYGWGWAPGWYDPFWPEASFEDSGPLPESDAP